MEKKMEITIGTTIRIQGDKCRGLQLNPMGLRSLALRETNLTEFRETLGFEPRSGKNAPPIPRFRV